MRYSLHSRLESRIRGSGRAAGPLVVVMVVLMMHAFVASEVFGVLFISP
ncbi:MAG TPA: hypothetical protein VLF14_04505 [Candidatus Binatia bacterium]|nr:hypothetical protein [Candidatus Binatia bacterium]